jgi:hypothetical protein
VSAPTFALLAGLAYTALGFLGFIPSLLVSDRLLGFFPVNGVVNVLHVVLGFWGLFSWSGATSAVGYARASAGIFAALALLGLYASLDTPLALLPVRGNDVWLHGLTALAAAYFGFRSAARRERSRERRRSRIANRRVARRPVVYERRTGAFDRRQARFGGSTLAAG